MAQPSNSGTHVSIRSQAALSEGRIRACVSSLAAAMRASNTPDCQSPSASAVRSGRERSCRQSFTRSLIAGLGVPRQGRSVL